MPFMWLENDHVHKRNRILPKVFYSIPCSIHSYSPTTLHTRTLFPSLLYNQFREGTVNEFFPLLALHLTKFRLFLIMCFSSSSFPPLSFFQRLLPTLHIHSISKNSNHLCPTAYDTWALIVPPVVCCKIAFFSLA